MTNLLRALPAALLLLTGVDAALAQESEPDPMLLLKQFSETLGAAERFRYVAETGFDVVQDNGQKIEFGTMREVTVRRPNRGHGLAVRRDGRRAEFFFDGQQATLFEKNDNVYASTKVPGTLEAALDYLTESVGLPSPLAELVSADLFAELSREVESSVYVKMTRLGERRCHHVAFRQANIDWQLFVEAGVRALPCRIVITYKNEEDSPQFWVNFLEWDLAPEAPDELFIFKKPEGAEQVPFVAVGPVERDVE